MPKIQMHVTDRNRIVLRRHYIDERKVMLLSSCKGHTRAKYRRIFCPKQPTEWLPYWFPQLKLADVADKFRTGSYVRNGFLQGFSILIFLFYTKIIASKKIIQTNNFTEDRNWNHSDSHAF